MKTILSIALLFALCHSAAPDSALISADKFYAQGSFDAAADAYRSACDSLNSKDKKLCLFNEIKSLIESKKFENLQSAEIKLVSLLSQTEPSDSLFAPLFATDARLQIMLTQPERAVRSWRTAAGSASPDYFSAIYTICLDLIESFPANGLTNENCQKIRPSDTTLISLPRTKTAPIAKVAPAQPSVQSEQKPSQTGCFIQLGAFGKKENAERLTENFKQKGVNLYISDDSKLFFVRTGKFTNQANAKNYAEQKIAPVHNDYKIICP